MSPLIFATGPVRLDEGGVEARARFAKVLGTSLKREVEIRPALSYGELIRWVGRAEVHLAWLPPALFVHARHRFEVHLLVRSERAGVTCYRGALFVKKGSRITDLDDLRGTRVAWVDPDSCAGFLFPWLQLRTFGVDPAQLFSDFTMLRSHEAVVRAVEEGKADVGATYVQLEDEEDPHGAIDQAGWTRFVDKGAMRAVLVTAPIPSDVVCATSALSAVERATIREKLLSIHQGQEGTLALRGLLHVSRFREASEGDYEGVARALAETGQLQLGQS